MSRYQMMYTARRLAPRSEVELRLGAGARLVVSLVCVAGVSTVAI
jgi:hypothetical protein